VYRLQALLAASRDSCAAISVVMAGLRHVRICGGIAGACRGRLGAWCNIGHRFSGVKLDGDPIGP